MISHIRTQRKMRIIGDPPPHMSPRYKLIVWGVKQPGGYTGGGGEPRAIDFFHREEVLNVKLCVPPPLEEAAAL